MVGGSKFDEAKKVLENMGKNIIHCGPVGMGQVCIMPLISSQQDQVFYYYSDSFCTSDKDWMM